MGQSNWKGPYSPKTNIFDITFVGHFIVIMDVEAEIIVFELRESKRKISYVLDFNKGREDTESVVFVFGLVEKVHTGQSVGQ